MEDTSSRDSAAQLLAQCVAGKEWDRELVDRIARDACSNAVFGILAEGLADRFEPKLCENYAAIFSLIFERHLPGAKAWEMYARYLRIRQVRPCDVDAKRVVVLSRVTLGADVAISSVMIDAAKQRFPRADIYFAGSRKAYELFERDEHIRPLAISYPRDGSVADRLSVWHSLEQQLAGSGAIVIDPDSRLTQLGLLPLGEDARYFFFESRSYGGDGEECLSDLARRWAAETFGVEARARLALDRLAAGVAVSFGVGGNEQKRVGEEFERDLVRLLVKRYGDVVVDRGFGPQESSIAEASVAGTGARLFQGSFARFAELIGGARAYAGYDSAGQHAAALLGIPLVTAFKGFISERMFQRWQPAGDGPKHVMRADDNTRAEDVVAAFDSMIGL